MFISFLFSNRSELRLFNIVHFSVLWNTVYFVQNIVPKCSVKYFHEVGLDCRNALSIKVKTRTKASHTSDLCINPFRSLINRKQDKIFYDLYARVTSINWPYQIMKDFGGINGFDESNFNLIKLLNNGTADSIFKRNYFMK